MLEPYVDFIECLLTPLLLGFMVPPRSALEMCPLSFSGVMSVSGYIVLHMLRNLMGQPLCFLACACIFERVSP